MLPLHIESGHRLLLLTRQVNDPKLLEGLINTLVGMAVDDELPVLVLRGKTAEEISDESIQKLAELLGPDFNPKIPEGVLIEVHKSVPREALNGYDFVFFVEDEAVTMSPKDRSMSVMFDPPALMSPIVLPFTTRFLDIPGVEGAKLILPTPQPPIEKPVDALIAFAIDRSGSMQARADEVRNGFNKYIEDQRKLGLDARVYVALFDDQYDPLNEGNFVPISEVGPLQYSVRGSTALYDAAGKTLGVLRQHVGMLKPKKAMIVIMTDGRNNASHEWTLDGLLAEFQKARTEEKIEVVFLGEELAAREETAHMESVRGMNTNNVLGFRGGAGGTLDAFAALSSATTRYLSGAEPLMEGYGVGGVGDKTKVSTGASMISVPLTQEKYVRPMPNTIGATDKLELPRYEIKIEDDANDPRTYSPKGESSPEHPYYAGPAYAGPLEIKAPESPFEKLASDAIPAVPRKDDEEPK